MEQINWYGVFTLAKRETWRFLRVYNQTIIAPAISSLIFLAVFTLAIGTHKTEIAGIKFINFMGYGLIAMSMVQNAFANSSSSFIMSKVIGYITDILTPPLGGIEIIFAITIGAMLRGILVAITVSIVLAPFIDYTIYHLNILIIYVFLSCAFLGMIGIFAGIIANSFDQVSIVINYIITPLSFLSGTFYSISSLPIFFQKLNNFNPFFYMINGMRFALTNHTDGSINGGIIYLFLLNIIVFFILKKLLDIGWRIKS